MAALTLKDDTGDPVDLTGYTARMQARESVCSPAPLLSLTTADGGITIDGPAGLISWVVDDAVTATWTWRHGVFDLEIESGGGITRRLLAGEILVDPEVTR